MAESREYGPSEDEIEGPAEDGAAEEVAEALREDLGFIYANPDNGRALEEIIQLVETNYE